jgi:hypothetical protein
LPIEQTNPDRKVIARIECRQIRNGGGIEACLERADEEACADEGSATVKPYLADGHKTPPKLIKTCQYACSYRRRWQGPDDNSTMIGGIQYFGPSHRPTAAESGWKVRKKSDTAELRSSGEAPISLVKPEAVSDRAETSRPQEFTVLKPVAAEARVY